MRLYRLALAKHYCCY